MTDERIYFKQGLERILLAIHHDHDGVIRINQSALNRMNWFAAISGLAVINTWSVFSTLAPSYPYLSFTVTNTILIWFATGFISILTHFIMDESASADHSVHIKRNELIVRTINQVTSTDYKLPENLGTQIDQILDYTHPDLVLIRRSSLRLGNAVRWLERITFAALLISLLLTAKAMIDIAAFFK